MEEDIATLGPLTGGSEGGNWKPSWPYRVYVLALLSTTYLLNQIDRFMLAVVTQPMAQDIHYGDLGCLPNSSTVHHAACNATDKLACSAITDTRGSHVCVWTYTGQGMEYQLLIGPVFIIVYTVSGVMVSLAADQNKRKAFLVVSLMFWSLMTLLTAEVTSYWQLVLVRLGLGISQAGCTPFATSLLADYFDEGWRASALGVYNWGIYVGYSLTYAIGNFVTDANIFGQGWRWAFYISGWPGVFLAALIVYSLRKPSNRTARLDQDATHRKTVHGRQECLTWCVRLTDILRPFAQPTVLLLCLAGSVRNAAGYVWAYNTQLYYQNIGESATTIGSYMSWIPLLGGSIGVFLGGFISDRIVKRIGPRGRLMVLIVSQMGAVPFVAGALYLNPPYAYFSLLPGYIIGEMWVAITLAVLVELVPPRLRTSAVAVYLFIISNVAGNVPLLVPVLKTAFINSGLDAGHSLRAALYILYPGLYLLGAALYLVTLLALQWMLPREQHAGYEPIEGTTVDT